MRQPSITTPLFVLMSPLVNRGPWMSTVVLYCWCHSDNASVLLYFTLFLFFSHNIGQLNSSLYDKRYELNKTNLSCLSNNSPPSSACCVFIYQLSQYDGLLSNIMFLSLKQYDLPVNYSYRVMLYNASNRHWESSSVAMVIYEIFLSRMINNILDCD